MRFHLNRNIAALPLLLAGAGVALGTVGVQPGAADPLSDVALARLASIAGSFAQGAEAAGARDVLVSTGTESAAVALATGGKEEVYGQQDTYLLVMRGSFVAHAAKRPVGMPPPTGTTLWVVVDQDSFAVTDWGLSQDVIDASALGSVVQIRTR